MSNAVYPNSIAGLMYPVLKTQKHNTLVQPSPSAVETRIAQSYNPVWEWTLMYEWLLDNFQGSRPTPAYAPATDLRYLLGFVLARQGMYDDFLFDDVEDDTVGPALTGSPLAPNTQAELQLFNDGGSPPTYYSPIQRNMGGLFWEDITDLNGSIAVYANGVEKTQGVFSGSSIIDGDYAIGGPGLGGNGGSPLAIPGYSFAGLYIQWATAPATPITASFQFYFRVRFSEDTADFEQWAKEIWTIGGEESRNGTGTLKLMSARTARI